MVNAEEPLGLSTVECQKAPAGGSSTSRTGGREAVGTRPREPAGETAATEVYSPAERERLDDWLAKTAVDGAILTPNLDADAL